MSYVNQLENQLHKKAGKGPQQLKHRFRLVPLLLKLRGSFEGLRDSMNMEFAGLGNSIASHSGHNGDEDSDDRLGDDCDLSVSKDYDKSFVEEEPPAKNPKPNESGKRTATH